MVLRGPRPRGHRSSQCPGSATPPGPPWPPSLQRLLPQEARVSCSFAEEKGPRAEPAGPARPLLLWHQRGSAQWPVPGACQVPPVSGAPGSPGPLSCSQARSMEKACTFSHWSSVKRWAVDSTVKKSVATAPSTSVTGPGCGHKGGWGALVSEHQAPPQRGAYPPAWSQEHGLRQACDLHRQVQASMTRRAPWPGAVAHCDPPLSPPPPRGATAGGGQEGRGPEGKAGEVPWDPGGRRRILHSPAGPGA